MKLSNRRKAFVAVLSVFTVGASCAALSAGCNKTVGYIDAPTEKIEAELGTYVIPDYEVVDSKGMILAGYEVYVKSIKNPDGKELSESYGNAVTVSNAGVYSFVYSAGDKKVKDVTVNVDFADRTAPTINCDDSTIPKFFIKGNSYRIPSYTLSGDYDSSKCWTKVFHIAEDKKETEVEITSNRFKVEKDSGSYAIRIHVEDAAGNPNDYEFIRNVDGPEQVVEHKLLYLDEQFGERQVSCYQSAYKGGFVSKDDGAKTFGDEQGAYKVTFDGVTETQYNEGLLVLDVPALIDISEYENIYLNVYNDSDRDIVMGSQWWNDTSVKKGQWTRLQWDTRNWGGANGNMNASNTKAVGLVDITGHTIRFIFDYGQSVIPNGTFYLSAMYGTPKVKTEITAGENVILDGYKFFINDTIQISAEELPGKTVDCFKVDGQIISGDSFVATKAAHRVEVIYVDGELNADNMTWSEIDTITPAGGDIKKFQLGNDTEWVVTYDFYGLKFKNGFEADGNQYFGAYVGNVANGTDQIIGFEISQWGCKFDGYGGEWKPATVALNTKVLTLLKNATEEKPLKVIYIREGEIVKTLLYDGEEYCLVAVTNLPSLGVTSNAFGFAVRNGFAEPEVLNLKSVAGSVKPAMYLEKFAVDVTYEHAFGDRENYTIGDTVTLTAEEAPAGKMFAYFTANGEKFEGDKYVLDSFNVQFEAVYNSASTVTLAQGISVEDGRTGTIQVAKDTKIVIDFTQSFTPSGKYFVGFKVDGEVIEGNVVDITAETHSIEAVFEDRIQTGNEKLNEVSDVENVIYAQKDGADNWVPKKVEYDTEFRFGGPDASVDETGMIKLTTASGGENSYAFDSALVENLDEYTELFFYVYTEAKNVKAGAWWCADTNIIPGKWTKVSILRGTHNAGTIIGNGESIVWNDGVNKFAFRIFNAPENATVYVTALYGVPYPDSNVTFAEDSEGRITLSAPANGKSYKIGEEVTLTLKGEAPAGQAFAYFTANGERIDGNTYVLTETVEFAVVYNEISALTLGNGIETADGKTTYGRGAKVTLRYGGTPETGKLFDYFTVDGERIAGSSFITSKAAHTVAAVFADGADKLTWITGDEADKSKAEHSWSAYKFTGKVLGESDKWIVETTIGNLEGFKEGQDKWYGFDYLVGANATVHIRIHTSGLVTVTAMGTAYEDGENIGTVYGANKIVAACKAATDENPVKFTAVRDGGTYYVLFNGELVLRTEHEFKAADNKFGVGATDCGWLPLYEMTDYKFRQGADIVDYSLTSKVTAEKAALDKADGVYKIGDTVKLTAEEAEAGFKFLHFTVDGEEIEGDTFVINSNKAHKVTAVYAEISTLTLAEGVETADGETEYARGATVTLNFAGTAPAGKFFDCFKVDGVKINGNTFNTSAATHEIEVVFATGAADMSWNSVDYVKPEGGDPSCHVIDSAENYVFTYDLYGMEEGWRYIGAYVGNDSVKNGTLLLGYELSTEDGSKFSAYGGAWVNYSDGVKLTKEQYDMLRGATSENPVKAIYVRQGDVFKAFLSDGEKTVFVATVTVTQLGGINNTDFGFGRRGGEAQGLKFATVENTQYVKGADKTNAYMQTHKVTLTKTDVTTDKEEYILGDTVVLTVAAEGDGKKFAYFEVNGNRLDDNKFVVSNVQTTVKAVYNEVSEVTLGADVQTADGKSGKIEVAKDSLLTFVYVGTPADDKYFKGFAVDGTDIDGNTFTVTGLSHTVTAVCADRVVSGNAQLNDLENATAESGTCEYVNDKKYVGMDGDVKESGTLKLTGVTGGDICVKAGAALGDKDMTAYKEVYFYIWADADGALAGTWWCNDTAVKAGQWTKVTIYKDSSKNSNGGYDADGYNGKLFAAGSKGDNFRLRIQGGQNKTFYITSLYGVLDDSAN